MPVLAAWFGSLFTSLVGFFAAYMTKRVAIIAAIVALIISTTATFIAAVEVLMASLAQAMPSEIAVAASWVWPDNANSCIGVYISVHLLTWAWSWNTRILQLKLF